MENPREAGGFTFLLMSPLELDEAFRFIEPGLINAFTKSKVNWNYADIPQMVKANLMSLITIWQKNEDNTGSRFAGFFVVRHQYHGFPPEAHARSRGHRH